jgi:hypothetical protein
MTKGEYKVGIDFNPGTNPHVDGVKQITAGLIDEMEDINLNNKIFEAKRCAAIAATKYEEACMWAVKALTKPQMRPADE